MVKYILSSIDSLYPLEEINCENFASLKASGMKFNIKAYKAKGLGHVSVMQAKGFFGLMQMDTVIINPKEVDLPLYSYDRVFAMGNDTLIVELYDTFANKTDCSALENVKNEFALLPEHNLGSHWYDDIKLKESISKRGKKSDRANFDLLVKKYFDAFLSLGKDNEQALGSVKQEKAKAYVDGLLENGGPSTDVFTNNIGKEKTAELFYTVLFGTK